MKKYIVASSELDNSSYKAIMDMYVTCIRLQDYLKDEDTFGVIRDFRYKIHEFEKAQGGKIPSEYITNILEDAKKLYHDLLIATTQIGKVFLNTDYDPNEYQEMLDQEAEAMKRLDQYRRDDY